MTKRWNISGSFLHAAKSNKMNARELSGWLKITTIIMGLMPIAVFCAITSMVLPLGGGAFMSLIEMVGTFLFGLLFMMVIYSLILLIFGRQNPVIFWKKYVPTMLQVFSIASINASIPVNMEACEKKLGIDKKIYSFSIPVGATLNMDGTCVMLAVFTLTLAKMYGIVLPGSAVLSMALSIILLSMGAPCVPGAMVVCFSALFSQIGLSLDAINIVVGLGPILGMFLTMTNCLGDVVVTTVVAKSEGLLREETYT